MKNNNNVMIIAIAAVVIVGIIAFSYNNVRLSPGASNECLGECLTDKFACQETSDISFAVCMQDANNFYNEQEAIAEANQERDLNICYQDAGVPGWSECIEIPSCYSCRYAVNMIHYHRILELRNLLNQQQTSCQFSHDLEKQYCDDNYESCKLHCEWGIGPISVPIPPIIIKEPIPQIGENQPIKGIANPQFGENQPIKGIANPK